MEEDATRPAQGISLIEIRGEVLMYLIGGCTFAGIVVGSMLDSTLLGALVGFSTPLVVPAALNDLRLHRAAARGLRGPSA